MNNDIFTKILSQNEDKQNNLNIVNQIIRKRHVSKRNQYSYRPLTSDDEVSKNNHRHEFIYEVEIPTFGNWRKNKVHVQTPNCNNQFETLEANPRYFSKDKSQARQGPIVQKNSKLLKQFFGNDSSRYYSKRVSTSSEQSKILRSETLDASTMRRNRKQMFKRLYLKQKEKYEEVLRKYGIQEKVDDSEFYKFIDN